MVCAWNPGQYDELETFNYPLTAQQVAAGYPNFGGNTTNMLDTYYVGRSDMLQTYVDGFSSPASTNLVPCRLGYWRFDSPLLYAEQGQIPLFVNDISLVPDWSGTALNINSHSASQITYPDVGSNGWANINCRQGSLRFWFKPNGSGGTGHSSPFVYMGTANASDEWGLWLNGGHTSISFITASNNAATTNFTASCSLSTTNWTQIVLTYGSNVSCLYTNGSLAKSGTGVSSWPGLANRELGIVIGNSTAYNVSINGQFDEMETFNYQLAPNDIASNFQIVANVDSDLNGIPDLLEDIHLTTARPFLGAPVVITGTIEAEQFDLGGPGIGYHNAGSHPPSAYRPTGMFITNCNDLGGGYCLDQTQAGDWAQYSINVLVPQTYMVEVRAEAIGTNTGGVFQCDFTNGVGVLTNSAGISNGTGPLTITTTNWTNVSKVVYLTTGTKVITLHCLTNAPGSTNVGRFNYISIYPWWQEGFTSTYTNTITVAELSTNNDWVDAANNAAVIQQEIKALPATGGTVLLPAGTYLVAQANPDENKDAWYNAAVSILTNNVEIAGVGKNDTTLIAYNRATTVFCLGQAEGPGGIQLLAQCTNFTLRDMTIEAQPHLAVTNVTSTVYEAGQFFPAGNNDAGALTIFYGLSTNQYAYNVLVTNCQFLDADRSIVIPLCVSNVMVRACNFIPCGGMDTWGDTNVYTGQTNFTVQVGIYGRGGTNFNLVVLENTYNGNILLTNITTNTTDWFAPNGFVWFQGEGNAFIARNFITNNALEAVQLNAGPNSVAGNTFYTLVSDGSCCALNAFNGGQSGLTGTSFVNYSTCFVGNSVYGGRHGEDGVAASQQALPYTINFSGNSLSLYPPFDLGDAPGAAVYVQYCQAANVCGNSLVSGGYGVSFTLTNDSALILNNNFTSVTYRGIGYIVTGGSLNTAQVFGNTLGQGVSFHVQLPYTNSFGWFLDGNTYFNGASNSVPPFLDPLSSAVHIFN